MEKALVTGGAGFLGQYLVRALLNRGDLVRSFDLEVPPVAPKDLKYIKGDVRDKASLVRACEGMNVVYHLASLIPQRKGDVETMRAVNVEGTRNVLEAAREAGVRRVVYLSSVEIFGVPKKVPCSENGPLEPLGEYGSDKIAAEQLCRESNKKGLPVVILRPPTIIGPGLDEPFLLNLLASIKKGSAVTLPGKGDNRFQFIHVEDVVSACLLAADNPNAPGEAFNIGGKNVPSISECVRLVAERVGSPSYVRHVPVWLVRLAIGILRPFGKAPLEPEHVKIAMTDYLFDIGKAKRVLGWEPRHDIVDALVETYRAIVDPESPGEGRGGVRSRGQ